MEERLQKILSTAGVCSRRSAEARIAQGRVTVNNLPAKLGDRADPDRDEIAVDGIPLPAGRERAYLMLHKPRGYVTSLSDEKHRKTAALLVAGCGRRVWPVGRLDMNSEGLLLFTDDGAFTYRLTHPKHEIEKEYEVWAAGDLRAALPVLSGPLELDGVRLAPAKVSLLESNREGGVLSVTICQGKNRQVRRMCALAGLSVRRLKRVREGSLCLGNLPPGKWRFLTPEEVRCLLL